MFEKVLNTLLPSKPQKSSNCIKQICLMQFHDFYGLLGIMATLKQAT